MIVVKCFKTGFDSKLLNLLFGQDFKAFYDAMFGRKREKSPNDRTESQIDGEAAGNEHANGVAQENRNEKRAEMAIYEQFQRQV